VAVLLTVVAIIAVAFIFLYRLQDSRIGRAWVAIREDELAAASMGINTITTKLLAFSIGASTSGLAGVFYASKLSIVSPTSSGSPSRSPPSRWWCSAAWATSGVSPRARSSSTRSRARPQAARRIRAVAERSDVRPRARQRQPRFDRFRHFQYLLYGLALVTMMLLRPEGLFPSRRRRSELHETPDEAAESNEELVQA